MNNTPVVSDWTLLFQNSFDKEPSLLLTVTRDVYNRLYGCRAVEAAEITDKVRSHRRCHHARSCVRIFVCMRAGMRVCMCACVCMCVCVCMRGACVCLYAPSVGIAFRNARAGFMHAGNVSSQLCCAAAWTVLAIPLAVC